MTATHHGPGNTSGDSVVDAVDEQIRLEALRQLESINCDDDDWRIDPLPPFDVGIEVDETITDENRRN